MGCCTSGSEFSRGSDITPSLLYSYIIFRVLHNYTRLTMSCYKLRITGYFIHDIFIAAIINILYYGVTFEPCMPLDCTLLNKVRSS